MVNAFLKQLNKVAVVAGYRNLTDYLVRLVLPVGMILSLLGLFIYYFLTILPWFTGFVVLGAGWIIALGYAPVKYSSANKDIQENLHLFITYAGTISTMKVERGILFRKMSEKKVFGEISEIFSKAYYLAKGWNLGYAEACRVMVDRTPNPILADFLDRMAVVMDFGQNLETFLYDEQKSILDDYEIEYKKSLESIKMIQDLFISLTISFAFILGLSMLAPLMLDIPIENIILIGTGILLLLDICLIIALVNLVPRDDLTANLKEKNHEQKTLKAIFIATFSFSLIIFIMLNFLVNWELITILAISSIPLAIPGFMGNTEEQRVERRNKQFPIYVRILGTSIQVRDGGVISALRSIQVHDFGVINSMSVNLYRRLRIGSDKFKSWYKFAVESGSRMISNFSKIFSESVYLGGNAEKIGEIVSANMTRLTGLRKFREQQSGSLRGAFYGSMIGLIATVFVTAKIAELLLSIFGQQNLEGELSDLADTIIPTTQTISFEAVFLYVSILILFHSAASAWIMKIIDGGSKYTALIDFILLLWIGAALAWIVPQGVDALLPDIAEVFEDFDGDGDAIDIEDV